VFEIGRRMKMGGRTTTRGRRDSPIGVEMEGRVAGLHHWGSPLKDQRGNKTTKNMREKIVVLAYFRGLGKLFWVKKRRDNLC